MTDRPLGWGILATGRIAHSFARDLALVPGARVAAAGARRQESADAFVAEFGGRAHASYAALVEDPDVDVVYVASPHSLHAEHVRLALDAGKPVLCEKPLTLNAAQATELFALAETRGLFLMEAMWMACHPVIRSIRERLQAGDLGNPQQLSADLGWVVRRAGTDRLLDPDLGGGALLDMGVYPLTLADLLLGEPTHLTGSATLSESGVDLNVAITTAYSGGAVAALTASMTANSPRSAWLATDTGRLDIPAPFHHPPHALWSTYDGAWSEPTLIGPPYPIIGSGLGNEAAEVMRCLREGLTESPMVPAAQTLRVMRQMDAAPRAVRGALPRRVTMLVGRSLGS